MPGANGRGAPPTVWRNSRGVDISLHESKWDNFVRLGRKEKGLAVKCTHIVILFDWREAFARQFIHQPPPEWRRGRENKWLIKWLVCGRLEKKKIHHTQQLNNRDPIPSTFWYREKSLSFHYPEQLNTWTLSLHNDYVCPALFIYQHDRCGTPQLFDPGILKNCL